jgi:hypothetical protein
VDRVLLEPHYRANAERLAGRLSAARGPERAAELLESLVASSGEASVAKGERW